MQFFAVVLACLLQGALSQVASKLACPNIKPAADFNNDIVDGIWYIPQIYPWTDLENVDCTYASYNNTPNNFNAAIGGIRDNQQVYLPYPGKIVSTGVFLITFDGSQTNVIAFASDNKSYISFFACASTEQGSSQFAWILTKERDPSQEIIDAARAAFTAQGISTDDLIVINQENCPAPIA